MSDPSTIMAVSAVQTFVGTAKTCSAIAAGTVLMCVLARLIFRLEVRDRFRLPGLLLLVAGLIAGDVWNLLSGAPGFSPGLSLAGLMALLILTGLRSGRGLAAVHAVSSFADALMVGTAGGSRLPRTLFVSFAAGCLSAAIYWVVANSPPAPAGGEFAMAVEVHEAIGGSSRCPTANANNHLLLLRMLAPGSFQAVISANKMVSAAAFGAAAAFTAFWAARLFSVVHAFIATVILIGLLGNRIVVNPQEDALLLPLAALTVWLMLRSGRPANRLMSHVAMGLLTGACIGTKLSALALAVTYGWALAACSVDLREVMKRSTAFAVGLGTAFIPLGIFSRDCPFLMSDLRLLGLLHLKGSQFHTIGNVLANQALSQLPVDRLLRVLAGRVSFQTAGEIAVGAAATVLVALLTYFPFTILKRDEMRPMSRFLVVTLVLMYGVLFWRTGDSSWPPWLLLPVGLIFYPGYLLSLGRMAMADRQSPSWRAVAWMLLALNGLLLTAAAAGWVHSAVRIGKDFGDDYARYRGQMSRLAATTPVAFCRDSDFHNSNVFAAVYPELKCVMLNERLEEMLAGDATRSRSETIRSVLHLAGHHLIGNRPFVYVFKSREQWDAGVARARFGRLGGCVESVFQFECEREGRRCTALGLDLEGCLILLGETGG